MEFDSVPEAAEALIRMYEDHLRSVKRTEQLVYTDLDVCLFIDGFSDIVALAYLNLTLEKKNTGTYPGINHGSNNKSNIK